MFRISHRQRLWLVVALAAVATVGSFFAQYVLGLNPCPLCILQRLAIMATGIVAVICCVLPARSFGSRSAVSLLASAAPVYGFGVAAYQIWLQSLPLDQQPACGAPWTFRLRDAPLFDWYEPVLRGTGQCGIVEKVFGIGLPVWSILFFGVILLVLWFGWWRSRQSQ